MKNNFDISELVITKIHTIYSHTVPECSAEKGIITHNTIVIKLAGESVYDIGKKDYTADSDNILFLPRGTSYALSLNKKGAAIIIEFDTTETGEVKQFFTNGEKEIAASAKNLLKFWSLGGPAYKSKCLSELYGIITQISVIDSYTNTFAEKYRLIHASVRFIEENYRREDLSTPMLAEISQIGETYYRSIFFDVFGCSPNKYIRNMRVEKAKELLAAAEGSLDEIAQAAGFAGSSYLCKVFKTVTGETPAAYAKRARLIG